MKSAKRLKIGFVLDDSLDVPDGVQQYVLTVGAWMKGQGHDVHYLVGQTDRNDIPNVHSMSKNIKVRFNKNRMTMPLPTSVKAIAAVLQREQFDILHVQMPYSPFMAGRLIKAAPPQTAVVGTFHIAPHSKTVSWANKLLKVVTKGSLSRFDAVFSVSPIAQLFARQTFGIESVVIPNTVDLAPYKKAKPLPAYGHELTIMFLGRLVDRKGCAYLLKAIDEIERHQLTLLPFKVVICGKGPLEDLLKYYVMQHELEDVVEFVGFIDEKDKPSYLASADIAVFPSTGGESFGIVLLEAMAAGHATVLAGDNPGYSSVMQPFPESLFDPKHTTDFAQKLADMLNDSGQRMALHDAQQREVLRYDVETVGRQIVAEYITALHKRLS